MKRYISMFLVFILAISLCPNAFATDTTYDYLVEAEDYIACNFIATSGVITSDATLSGGKYISLYTKTSGEYSAEYSVDVAEAGVYDIFLASSPVEGGWSSKIYMSVNGGAERSLSGPVISSTENSRIKYYNIGAVSLKRGANTIKYIVRDKIDSGYHSAFIDCFGLNLSSFKLSHIDSQAPMNVFEGGESVELKVFSNAPAFEDSTFTYTMTDLYGNTCKTGNVTIKSGQDEASIIFENINFGYYNLEVGTLKSGFSVVKPISERQRYNDTPFAVDAVLNGLNQWGINGEDYVKVLGLSGVTWIRDRIRFKDNVTYSNGKYTFGSSSPQTYAQMLQAYGIRVSNAAEYMPSNFTSDYGTYISDDLVEVYNFWKSAAQNYGNSVDIWEILNEVDGGGAVSSWDSPDLYAAFMKAAAIGISDGSNAMTAVQGAALNIDHSSEYGTLLMRNGIFDYSSVDNVHYHKKSSTPLENYYEFEGMGKVAKRVDAQKKLSERTPIWVTEAGIRLTAQSGVDLTSEQQLVQAKYLVTSTVESVANGTDKHFFFVGPRYHEGEISWGMMSEDTYRPYMYASLSAQSAMTDILGKGTYKGKIDVANDNVSAYLFDSGRNSVAVIWSKSGEQTVSLGVSGKMYDIWGNEVSTVGMGDSIEINSEPKYIVCTNCQVSVENMRDAQMTAGKKEIDEAKRVVLLQKYDDVARGGSRTDGYMISTGNNTVTLEVANLSDKTMTGKISYKTENNWKLDKNNVDISVAPMSVESITFTITPIKGNTTEYLTFVGTFGNQETSPSTVKLVDTKDGVITLEAETDSKAQNGFSAYTQDANQGLKVMTSDGDEYKIEFEVSSAEGRVYDLWTLGGILDYQWCSNHVIKVNGKEITPSPKNTSDILYWSGDNAVGWNSYNDVRLKTGTNNIEFSVSDIRNNGDNYIVSALDKIVLIPKNETGWIEAENFTTKTGLYYSTSNNESSNGTIMKLFTYDIDNPITENQINYDFSISTKENYDIWVLSSRANVDWMTKWKIGIDGNLEYPNPVTTIDSGMDIDSQSIYWYKVKENVSLNRGVHTIAIRGDEERANNDGKYMFHLVDAIAIVPRTYSISALNWKPSTDIKTNKITIIQKTLLGEYDLANITGNITLPQSIEDVEITWSSSMPEIVSTTGVVNRPEHGAGDKSVTLTAVFVSGNTTNTSVYNLTVKEFTDNERKPELSAEFVKSKDGYSGVRMYAKNTDILADESGNMPAVIVAKYSKTTNEFLGFLGDNKYTYTNTAGDKFVVNDNRVTCHITGAQAGTDVSFVVYKEGTKPGIETIAYANEYRGKAGNDDIKFTFITNKGEDAYRVVINKNGETYSKVIHIFEGQVIIYDENDTQDDIFVKQGIGQRVIKTKGEMQMPLWNFITPENEEDIIYKVFLWEWYSLKPLVESITLNK